MEHGTTAELYVLTPDEVYWIEHALGIRDAMARAAIAGARGRELRCDGSGSSAPCGKPPTHYARHSSSGLKLYPGKFVRGLSQVETQEPPCAKTLLTTGIFGTTEALA